MILLADYIHKIGISFWIPIVDFQKKTGSPATVIGQKKTFRFAVFP